MEKEGTLGSYDLHKVKVIICHCECASVIRKNGEHGAGKEISEQS